MKKIRLILLSVAALALATIPAPAQNPTSVARQLSGLPPTIPAATTTNLATPVLIDAGFQQNMGFQSDTKWSVTGTAGLTNLIYTLCPTVTGVNYSTNLALTLTQGQYNGLTNVWNTNLVAAGLKGWYITAIQNTHATGIATNKVYVLDKISSP